MRLEPCQRDCPLTPRQLEVLGWVAAGKTSRDQSEILGISAHGVERILRNAYERTGAANAPALVAMALRKGWMK